MHQQLNPRALFQRTAMAKQHQELVTRNDVLASLQIALAQMVKSFPAAGDMGTAAAYHFRVEGAKQFISTWLNLAEPDEPRTPPTTNKLIPE